VAVSTLGAAAAAVLVAPVTTPVTIRAAHRWGVLDRPGALKPHTAPVAYLGGVAVFAGIVVGLSVHGSTAPFRAVLPLSMALVLGLLDDVADLPVVPRLAGEAVTGAAAAWAVGGDSVVGYAVVGALCVVMINAVNFVDGIDGLAAATCALGGVGLLLVSEPTWAVLAAAMSGAAAGFLAYNRPPARIYLGDAGSYLLGTALAVLAGAYGRGDATVADGIVILACLALPLAEILSTVLRRLVARRPLFTGDRDHIYDRMVQRGMSPAAVTASLAAVQAAVVVVVLAASKASST
jgi:UDP-N-acetylmuramyl pentapeptide phosphotransferase/UDP-N-acetylglucosamine-1-phosphate transferase